MPFYRRGVDISPVTTCQLDGPSTCKVQISEKLRMCSCRIWYFGSDNLENTKTELINISQHQLVTLLDNR